jgi:hypothetical protein
MTLREIMIMMKIKVVLIASKDGKIIASIRIPTKR